MNPTKKATPEPAAAQQEKPAEERVFTTSQWQLMWRRSKKHRLAIVGGSVVACACT